VLIDVGDDHQFIGAGFGNPQLSAWRAKSRELVSAPRASVFSAMRTRSRIDSAVMVGSCCLRADAPVADGGPDKLGAVRGYMEMRSAGDQGRGGGFGFSLGYSEKP
jgi:hypothetical protein